MDENRMLDLMEKLYMEMQSMKSEMRQEFANVRAEVKDGFEDARKDRARLEHTLTEKIDTVADGVIQNTNRVDRLEGRVASLEDLIKERSIVVPKDYYIQLLKKAENE